MLAQLNSTEGETTFAYSGYSMTTMRISTTSLSTSEFCVHLNLIHDFHFDNLEKLTDPFEIEKPTVICCTEYCIDDCSVSYILLWNQMLN